MAHQMSENPNGIFARVCLCRLATSVIGWAFNIDLDTMPQFHA
jgi:hypothetical protein